MAHVAATEIYSKIREHFRRIGLLRSTPAPEPPKHPRRQRRADELRDYEPEHIPRRNAGKRVGEAARDGDRRICERC